MENVNKFITDTVVNSNELQYCKMNYYSEAALTSNAPKPKWLIDKLKISLIEKTLNRQIVTNTLEVVL